MSKVSVIYHQYERACDDPFVLSVLTELFTVCLPTVQQPMCYILRQEINDASGHKPLLYTNESLGATEDYHAQRVAILQHDALTQVTRRDPQRALRWIERARKGENPYEDDEMAPRVGEAQPASLPRRVLESLRDSAKTILEATREMLAREDALDAKLNHHCEVAPSLQQVYMHRDLMPKFVPGDCVRITAFGNERQGDEGVITEVGDFGYYAVAAAPGQPCWAWYRENSLERVEPPDPLPNLGAPIPDPDEMNTTSADSF